MCLIREVCAVRHLSFNTATTYTHWIARYASFLKDPRLKVLTSARKMEAFPTQSALTGISASTQNQAFNALLFLSRDVLKQEVGPVESLRTKRPSSAFPLQPSGFGVIHDPQIWQKH